MQRCFIDWERETVIFWSMKSACTSLANWFFYRLLEKENSVLEDLKKPSAGPRDWLGAYGYSAHFTIGQRLVVNKGFKSVAVVRNPALRLVSGYINKFVIYKNKNLDQLSALPKFAQDMYKDYASWREYPENQPYRGISFIEFLHYLTAFSGHDPHGIILNPHFAKQIPTHLGVDHSLYHHILKLEDDVPLADRLEAIFGKSTGFPSANVTPYSNEGEENLHLLEPLTLMERNAAFTPSSFINEETLPMIKRLYADDYREFGYE